MSENGHTHFKGKGDRIIINIAGAQLHHRANKDDIFPCIQ